jgi:hypothetical protein
LHMNRYFTTFFMVISNFDLFQSHLLLYCFETFETDEGEIQND